MKERRGIEDKARRASAVREEEARGAGVPEGDEEEEQGGEDAEEEKGYAEKVADDDEEGGYEDDVESFEDEREMPDISF